MARYVYFFGGGKADGNKDMKDLLGGKGAGLAEMTNAGLPVPPGFTVSTAACNLFVERKGSLPAEVTATRRRCTVPSGSTWSTNTGPPESPRQVSASPDSRINSSPIDSMRDAAYRFSP